MDTLRTGEKKTGKEPSRHRFHAICPYFAMFPEDFVSKWIKRVARKNDTICDPFCGRGTTPFQALMMGREAIACDKNPVAYCITRAKTNAPSVSAVRRRLTTLERDFNTAQWQNACRELPEFFHVAYHRGTLLQLLHLRSCLKWRSSRTDAMIGALVLGALHGESEKSPSYLSNQMPRTISTKPAYSVRFWKQHGYHAPERDAFALLRKQLAYRYASPPPKGAATVFCSDMRDLPGLVSPMSERIRCVITSPPYLNVTSFEEDQWLRLWFLGGGANPTYGRISRDDRHETPDGYWRFIADMWRMLSRILSANAQVIIRIGGKDLTPDQLVSGLVGASLVSSRRVQLAHHETSTIKRRQTDVFRPGAKGCKFEVDCHFRMR